jgi:hypothetical protein
MRVPDMSDSHWLVTGMAFFAASLALRGETNIASWFTFAVGCFAIAVSMFVADKDGDR